MNRFAANSLVLLALIVATLGVVSPAVANDAEVSEQFVAAIAGGDLETAERLLTEEAKLTEVAAWNGEIRPDRLFVLVANTQRMERIGDYTTVVQNPEAATRSRYPNGFAFWYGETSRLPETRLVIELAVDGERVGAVHRYWIGPVPPPVAIVPEREE